MGGCLPQVSGGGGGGSGRVGTPGRVQSAAAAASGATRLRVGFPAPRDGACEPAALRCFLRAALGSAPDLRSERRREPVPWTCPRGDGSNNGQGTRPRRALCRAFLGTRVALWLGSVRSHLSVGCSDAVQRAASGAGAAAVPAIGTGVSAVLLSRGTERTFRTACFSVDK